MSVLKALMPLDAVETTVINVNFYLILPGLECEDLDNPADFFLDKIVHVERSLKSSDQYDISGTLQTHVEFRYL